MALHDEGIHSCTVQPEFTFSDSEQSGICDMLCGESCAKMTCCPPENANKVCIGFSFDSSFTESLDPWTEFYTADRGILFNFN